MAENTLFNFSIPELGQRGDKIANVFTRDKAEFISYGYPEETAASIISQTETLKEFPSDEFYEGEQRMATHEKNVARETLQNLLLDLRNRAQLVYGINSVDYKAFSLGRLADLNDNEMVQRALHVSQVASVRLDKLAEKMVTQETLDTILDGRSNLDDAIDKQATAITRRREKKIERLRLANSLYKLISELSGVGKLIWKNKNEAYYLDYVIYGSNKAMAEQTETPEVETE